MKCPPRSHTILVIDDDDGIRQSIEVVLDISGFKTLVAADGRQAFSMMACTKPDLIMIDGNLPGLSGEQIIGMIRRSDTSIPIIGVSAEDRRWSMLEAGATAFFEKPFDPDALLSNIDHLLKWRY